MRGPPCFRGQVAAGGCGETGSSLQPGGGRCPRGRLRTLGLGLGHNVRWGRQGIGRIKLGPVLERRRCKAPVLGGLNGGATRVPVDLLALTRHFLVGRVPLVAKTCSVPSERTFCCGAPRWLVRPILRSERSRRHHISGGRGGVVCISCRGSIIPTHCAHSNCAVGGLKRQENILPGAERDGSPATRG